MLDNDSTTAVLYDDDIDLHNVLYVIPQVTSFPRTIIFCWINYVHMYINY